jgi:hypothetical protein
VGGEASLGRIGGQDKFNILPTKAKEFTTAEPAKPQKKLSNGGTEEFNPGLAGEGRLQQAVAAIGNVP